MSIKSNRFGSWQRLVVLGYRPVWPIFFAKASGVGETAQKSDSWAFTEYRWVTQVFALIYNEQIILRNFRAWSYHLPGNKTIFE